MSERDPTLSDEALQALLDGEYSAEESARLFAQLRSEESLKERACELRMLKDTVRLAYRDVPPPQPSGGDTRCRGLWQSLAAGLVMLVVGLFIGWGLNPGNSGQRFVMVDESGLGAEPAKAAAGETRIVFHLTNPDMTVAGDLLNEVERLLNEYETEGTPLRVEVVAHGEGLGLLRQRLSSHQERIHALARHYRNLTFVACQNTIDRLRVERGVEVVLLPEAKMTASGVDHVVRRQQEGWIYIRV